MDREKVIKGLECCLGSNDCDIEPEEDCPYKGMCLCEMALHIDILSLLKEQEAIVRCKDCKHAVAQDCEQVWCSFVDDGLAHEPNWFCADGERRDAD